MLPRVTGYLFECEPFLRIMGCDFVNLSLSYAFEKHLWNDIKEDVWISMTTIFHLQLKTENENNHENYIQVATLWKHKFLETEFKHGFLKII